MADEPNNPQNPPNNPAAPDPKSAANPEPWYAKGGYSEAEIKVLSKYPTDVDAHKALVAAQPLIHGKISLPKPDAAPEDRAKVTREILGQLGAPEKADAYKLDEVLPEGVRNNAHYGEYKKEMEAVLTKHGVLVDAFKEICAIENKYVGLFGQEYETAKTEGIKALKAKVGESNWADFKANAKAAALKFGSEGLAKLVDEEENPALMALAHEVWDAKLREGTGIHGQSPTLKPQGGPPAAFSDEFYAHPDTPGAE